MNDPITTAPVVSALQPYITMIVSTIIGIIVPLAFAKLNQFIGVRVGADLVNQVKLEAQKEAAILVAASANNLAEHPISLSDGIVKAAARNIIEAIPTVIEKARYSPEDVAREVAAAIGHLQALHGPAAVPVVVPVAAPK